MISEQFWILIALNFTKSKAQTQYSLIFPSMSLPNFAVIKKSPNSSVIPVFEENETITYAKFEFYGIVLNPAMLSLWLGNSEE